MKKQLIRGEKHKEQYMNDQRLEATLTQRVDGEESLTYDHAEPLRWAQGSKSWDHYIHTDPVRMHNDSIILSYCEDIPVYETPVL